VSGKAPWDEPPFAWLQGALGLLALYITILILTTQRREDAADAGAGNPQRAEVSQDYRAAGEMRRDSPTLKNRTDEEAAARAVAADPQAVLDAIKDSEDLPLAAVVEVRTSRPHQT
jgi:uncharacterized membrane protein